MQERYRVRFTDASEAGLRRSEFTILKAMKEGGLAGASLGQDVDWNAFVIYRCVVGSRAYGLEDDASDVDRRGFFLPTAELHWSLYGVPEQLETRPRRRPTGSWRSSCASR
ncbi:MAG: DNA polymerase beta superfamily protein [Thermoanaerobaculia bacterium]